MTEYAPCFFCFDLSIDDLSLRFLGGWGLDHAGSGTFPWSLLIGRIELGG